MKVWTVTYVQESDVMPFRYSYNSHTDAMKGVEENAKEDHDALDSTSPFEGVDWADDKMTAFVDIDDSEAGYWIIQETQLQGDPL